jgi:transcriptional regulator with PAS, ATPase and Fis domain
MSPRELAAKAKASAQLLALVFSNSADAIFVVDQDYRFAFLHSPRQFSQSNNAGGKPCYESVMGKNVPCDFCPISKNGSTQPLPTSAIFSRGEKQYEIKICPLTYGDGTSLYLHFLRDITTPGRRELNDAESQHLHTGSRQPVPLYASPDRLEAFIGASPECVTVKEQIQTLIAFPTVTVLLEGETGTGKELIAELLHNATFGKSAPFVAIDCPAIPDHLLESELFGYEKGAFTDASQTKPGLFELAHGGTLFLDEVSSLSPNLQPKLLRVLETKSFSRLGSVKKIAINCRIACASNKPLRAMVEEGKFREDLYQRLSSFIVTIPPLRERSRDIAPLVHAVIDQASRDLGKKIRGITPEALVVLEAYRWPGNVRELKKLIERAVILTPKGESIDTSVLPKEIFQRSSDEATGAPMLLPLRDLEKQHLRKVLAWCRGNQSQTAKLLRISRTTLRKKLHDYHL